MQKIKNLIERISEEAQILALLVSNIKSDVLNMFDGLKETIQIIKKSEKTMFEQDENIKRNKEKYSQETEKFWEI